jgi:hypothetical protein
MDLFRQQIVHTKIAGFQQAGFAVKGLLLMALYGVASVFNLTTKKGSK